MSAPDEAPLVVVRGGGDLASGAARKLFLAGLRVVVTERPRPWCVRRRTSFATAVREDVIDVEGVRARLADVRALDRWRWSEAIAVVVHERGAHPPALRPALLVDARVLKLGHDTRIDDAPVVIGVGPGFTAGTDCHAAVETARGHDLGRVLYRGSTRPFDGRPGDVGGARDERVLRAPTAGTFRGAVEIGATVRVGQRTGDVDGRPVRSSIDGVVRGLLASGRVRAGQKVGDVDPRGDARACERVSDKANAVGGGVLEAALALLAGRAPRAGATR